MNEIILKYFYSCLGFIAIAMGVIGLFLPLMPTTCFLIAAVWAFSKSNPEIAKKILQHPQFGPTINTWMKYKSIDRKVKCKISMSIVIGFSITLLITTPSLTLSAFLISGMLILLFYINSRPEQNTNEKQPRLNNLGLADQKLIS